MSFDRKEFTASLKEVHERKQAAWQPVARLVQGAAVVMDGLVRDEAWGRYATYLQGVMDRFTVQRKLALDKLADPMVSDEKEMRKLKSDIAIADTTISTLKFAMELPVAIIKGGEEAKEFVKKFEDKNETAGNAQS